AAFRQAADQIACPPIVVFHDEQAHGPSWEINAVSFAGEASFAPHPPRCFVTVWSSVGAANRERRDMSRVLAVEDDVQRAQTIAAALGDHGLAVAHAATGREGLLKAAADPYDAIVLDRLLPGGLDGLGVLAALRAAGVEAPVLILSALSAVDERVRGLRA